MNEGVGGGYGAWLDGAPAAQGRAAAPPPPAASGGA
jgi:hypothetical protein